MEKNVGLLMKKRSETKVNCIGESEYCDIMYVRIEVTLLYHNIWTILMSSCFRSIYSHEQHLKINVFVLLFPCAFGLSIVNNKVPSP